MLIDARGLGCTKPVMMAQDTLLKIDEGILEILVDNEASTFNLSRFASKNGFYSETTKEDNYWNVKIVKGFVCEVPQKEIKPKETERDLFLFVATDTMGKEEELGKILMKGFFETMKVTKDLPHTIFSS